MKNQTVLQKVISDLENFKSFPMVDKPTIEAAIEFAKLRLEEEKQMIMDANIVGMEFIAVDTNKLQEDAEHYYSETYGKGGKNEDM